MLKNSSTDIGSISYRYRRKCIGYRMCWFHIRTSGATNIRYYATDITYCFWLTCWKCRASSAEQHTDNSSEQHTDRAAYWQSPCSCHVPSLSSSWLAVCCSGGRPASQVRVSCPEGVAAASGFCSTAALIIELQGHGQMLTHKKQKIIDMDLHSTPFQRIKNYLWLFSGAGRREPLFLKPFEPKKQDTAHFDEGQVTIHPAPTAEHVRILCRSCLF